MNIEKCQKCPIYNDGLLQLNVRKTHVIKPRYLKNTGKFKVLVVGEAGGQEECLSGIPFVGRAGKLLDKLLEESGLSKFDIKIDNAVKCRPIKIENGKYKNRTPTDEEIECCKPYMQDTLSFDPDFIILLGRIPFKSFFPDKNPAEFRGKGINFNYNGKDICTLLTYHPAYILRNPSERTTLLRHLVNACNYLNNNKA